MKTKHEAIFIDYFVRIILKPMKTRYIVILICNFVLSIHTISAQKTYPVYPDMTEHSIADDAVFIGEFDGKLIYFDRVSSKNKLWVSDGTSQGTKQISPADQVDINIFYKGDSVIYFNEQRGSIHYISKLETGKDTLERIYSSGIRYGDILYWQGKFSWIQQSAGSGYSRLQLYDPVNETLTTLVNADYLELRALGATDSLLFYILSNDQGKFLGSSDGTIQNSTNIKMLFPNGSSFDSQTRFFSNGEVIYFFYNPENNPYYLWTTDGTADGTLQLGSYENPFFGWEDYIFLENKFFFELWELGAPSGTTTELHATDGTIAGTMTLDANEDDYLQPDNLTLFQNKVYFTSYLIWNADLRSSDGTLQGTKLVLSGEGHESGSVGAIVGLGRYNNDLMLGAYKEIHGIELYKSNGTATGTVLVSDVIRGEESSVPRNFVQVGDLLFFKVLWESKERLWVYDPAFIVSCDSFQIDELLITNLTDSTIVGAVEVVPSGGQQPFVYELNNGMATYESGFDNLSLGVYTIQVTDNLGCTIEESFEIEQETAVVDHSIISTFSISPNPSFINHHFDLHLKLGLIPPSNVVISLHSLAGVLCYNEQIQMTDSDLHFPISTKGLVQGQYVLSIQIGGKVVVSKQVELL